MRLSDLPVEVLLCLADFLSQQELNRLLKTCHNFYTMLNRLLYHRDCHKKSSLALTWSAVHGCANTARKAIAAGAHIEQTRLRATEVYQIVHLWPSESGIFEKVAPLYIAATRNHTAIVRTLLENGAQVDTASQIAHRRVCSWETIGGTPLASATRMGCLASMKLLLEYGANPNASDSHGTTPLSIAVLQKNEQAVELLLSYGADQEKARCRGRTPITWVSYGRVKLFRLLLEHGADVGQDNDLPENPLSEAVRSGSRTITDTILERIDINPQSGMHAATGRTALGMAISQRRTELIHLLLDRGADPNDTQPPSLHVATQTPLWLAARRQSDELVTALLKKGANPNIAVLGETPLFMAVQFGREDIAKTLLAYGADPNTSSRPAGCSCRWIPMTPFARAMGDTNYAMAKLLLDYGADPNVLGWKGQTMLIRAMPKMGYEYIETMLFNGSDPNAATPHGLLPLFLAIMRGDILLTKLLLRYGADPNAEWQSASLLTWALRKNQLEISLILRENGAR